MVDCRRAPFSGVLLGLGALLFTTLACGTDGASTVADADTGDHPTGDEDEGLGGDDEEGPGEDNEAPDTEPDPRAALPAWTAPPLTGLEADCAWPPPKPGMPSLAQRAAYYDWIVPKLHMTPRTLPDGTPNEPSRAHDLTLDADVPTAIVPDDQLPRVLHYHDGENQGLWTSLYVGSQVFRHAVMKDAESLDNLRRTLAGTHRHLKITGKPGLYARDYIDGRIAGNRCPEDPMEYRKPTPPNHVGNRWVRVNAEGCSEYYDPEAQAFKKDGPCPGLEFAGMCWKANVSKDEYAGHLFVAGIAWRLIDDPQVRAMAEEIIVETARHLVRHGFHAHDYDDTYTRYGSFNALSFDEVPGYNALISLNYIQMGAVVSQDPALTDVYRNCLLQESGRRSCVRGATGDEWEFPKDYRIYFDSGFGLKMGCGTNYDNSGIALLTYFNIVGYEADEALRTTYRQAWFKHTKGPDRAGRDMWDQQSPFFNFITAARMAPETTEEMVLYRKLVHDGLCQLRRFPAVHANLAVDNTATYPQWCNSERHGSLAQRSIPVDERCNRQFIWWADPNERQTCAENRRVVHQPAGFLLPYWMGRFFGWITPEM